MVAAVTSQNAFLDLQQNVEEFHRIVTNPKKKLNREAVPGFVKELEEMIADFSGDKSNFLPLLYTYNLARRQVVQYLPKNAPQIFLPISIANPKDLTQIVTKFGRPPTPTPDACWKKLIDEVCKQADLILKKEGPVTSEKVQLVYAYNRARKIIGLNTVIATFMKDYPSFVANRSPLINFPMLFSFKTAKKFEEYKKVYSDILIEQLKAHNQNQAYPSRKSNLLFLGILVGFAVNIYFANRCGFIPSIITGIATQTLINYRKISFEAIKVGLAQGLITSSIFHKYY